MKRKNLISIAILILSAAMLLTAYGLYRSGTHKLEIATAIQDAAIQLPAAPFYWSEETSYHDHRIFRVDVLHAVLEQSHGEEFADMMCDILRTHPDKDVTFLPLWDEDVIDLGLTPIN